MFVLKSLLNIDDNDKATFLDEYVCDHEDHLVLQMFSHKNYIYEVFSKSKTNLCSFIRSTFCLVYFRMCHSMIIQIWTCCKSFATDFTRMRLKNEQKFDTCFCFLSDRFSSSLFLHYEFDNAYSMMMKLKKLFHMLDKHEVFLLNKTISIWNKSNCSSTCMCSSVST